MHEKDKAEISRAGGRFKHEGVGILFTETRDSISGVRDRVDHPVEISTRGGGKERRRQEPGPDRRLLRLVPRASSNAVSNRMTRPVRSSIWFCCLVIVAVSC